MRTTTRHLAGLALSATVAFTACGTQGSVEATAESAGRGSAGPSTTATPAPDAAAVVRDAAEAPARFDSSAVEILTVIDGEEVMRVSGAASVDGLRGDMVTSTPQGEVRVLVVDGTYYYQMPELPPGVDWVSMDAEEMQSMTGMDPTAASGAQATAALEVLGSVADGVERLEDGELFGQAVTRYRAHLTSAQLVDHGVASGLYTEELGEQMLSMYPDEFDMDVWIDADGLPRRQSWSIDLRPAPGAPTVAAEYRFDFPEWGGELEVSAPPPDRVRSLAQLQASSRD